MALDLVARNFFFYGSFLAIILICLVSNYVIVPVVIQMLIYTYSTILIGSHISLRQNVVDHKTGEKLHKTDTVGKTEAMMFPILGSCALLTLYIAYKYLPAYWINVLLTLYLTIMGTAAAGETFYIFLEPLLTQLSFNDKNYSYKISMYPFGSKEDPFIIEFNTSRLITYLLGAIAGVFLLYTKHFALHNMFAICFSIQAIALVSVGNFTVAALLLGGLLIYDIFWVFCTDVMVSVAKIFEGPAKLLFPVRFNPTEFSLLGLGDIVVPGIFIGMCLRFDQWLHILQIERNRRKQLSKTDNDDDIISSISAIRDIKITDTNTQKPRVTNSSDQITENTSFQRQPAYSNMDIIDKYKNFPKFYFYSTIIAYELGLLTTSVVLQIFQHPQPALLYLVPYCLLAFFGACALNGQLKEAFAYSEADQDDSTTSTDKAVKTQPPFDTKKDI